ncbi:MAG: dipeptide/oligopeptide/nickel ABC transporter ATP-binding protein, partial [Proteobacteria bacterium]|nr:dipeptide/oligopeptide/nickel ABC transporter ATP-binding protein [Pseudomonadota bacterium]
MMKLEGELASALAPPTGCHRQQARPICKDVYPGSTLITPDHG